jgi:uncharacterized membrane protein
MPETDKKDILYDYEEHFRVGLTEGKSEEEIARSLGNPQVIGNSYRIDVMLSSPKKDGSLSVSSVSRAVLASISLTFFNVVFVLGPFIGLIGILIGMWAIPLSLLVSGVAFIVSPVCPSTIHTIHITSNPWLEAAIMIFSGIGIGALGTLVGIGMLILTKWFLIGTAAYVRFNARIIRGER